MPNKKTKTDSRASQIEHLKMQNEALAARIANQRRVIDNRTTSTSKPKVIMDVGVLNRQQEVQRTLGQNPKARGVLTSGGLLSTREVNLLWRELGSTDDGRNFATGALHPCCENLPPIQGIPDRSAQPVATPSYRNTSTIAMPSGLSTTNWDVQIITISIPEVDYLWRTRENASNPWSSWNLVRPAAFPALADATGQTLGTTGYSKYRMMGRGYTIHHLASATTNQGVVVAGQVSAINGDYVARSTEATSSDAPVLQTLYSVPSGPQQLTQQDNLATEWEAVHGTYMPLRFDQTVELYKACGAGQAALFPENLRVPEHFVIIESAVTEGGTVGVNNIVSSPAPVFDTPADLPPATQMVYAASQACNQLVGVQFFLGLDPAATLQVKSRMHIEATAQAEGYAIQPFVHSSPVLDETSMNIVARVAQVQKHCYYAEYNDLGKMMKSIWNAVWPVGKYAATGLASVLPVIGGPLSATVSKINNPYRGSDWWSNL